MFQGVKKSLKEGQIDALWMAKLRCHLIEAMIVRVHFEKEPKWSQRKINYHVKL